jgi:ABC-type transporter Mla maintaining outer membrane lipid asymmetry ATPase subunit MlaF
LSLARLQQYWVLGKKNIFPYQLVHHLFFMDRLQQSGCGKTSLLAALSMRLRDETSGEIRFNGEVMSREKMTRISGFAAQNDVMLDGITVREHLYFMVSGKLNFHYMMCHTFFMTYI